MRFAKYQGIGNDFIMFADLDDRLELTPELVRKLCNRRFGIGADGVIRVAPGDDAADFFMDYVNSDGSVGEMCGNGIRCLALFARDKGLTESNEVAVATRAGLKTVQILERDRVRVDMGPPIFEATEIPVHWGGDPLHAKVELADGIIEAACVSLGNPHVVIFVDQPASAPVTTTGPLIEKHPMFPRMTNVEFAHVDSPDRVTMSVWERGSGETLACGTGACAVAVVARLLASTNEQVTITLPGGELEVEWRGSRSDPQPVFMTGPTEKAFEGDIELA